MPFLLLVQTWSERVRKLLPPIKALQSHSLVKLDQLLALQAEVCDWICAPLILVQSEP
jgi:hypothetical protein